MAAEVKAFQCTRCGKVIAVIKESCAPTLCCGKEMEELVPDDPLGAAEELHLPVFELREGRVFVSVGSGGHPMLAKHYIKWISLQTNCGIQSVTLHPGEAPEAVFTLCGDEEVEAICACCSLHGFWKA